MNYKQTKNGRLNEHLFYWKRIILIVLASVSLTAYSYIRFSGTEQEFRLDMVYIFSFGILIAGLYLVLPKYVQFIRISSPDDYVEVIGNNLVLYAKKIPSKKVSFPLNGVKRFNYIRKNIIELISSNGEELQLKGYENIEMLVQDLKNSPAGDKFNSI